MRFFDYFQYMESTEYSMINFLHQYFDSHDERILGVMADWLEERGEEPVLVEAIRTVLAGERSPHNIAFKLYRWLQDNPASQVIYSQMGNNYYLMMSRDFSPERKAYKYNQAWAAAPNPRTGEHQDIDSLTYEPISPDQVPDQILLAALFIYLIERL